MWHGEIFSLGNIQFTHGPLSNGYLLNDYETHPVILVLHIIFMRTPLADFMRTSEEEYKRTWLA